MTLARAGNEPAWFQSHRQATKRELQRIANRKSREMTASGNLFADDFVILADASGGAITLTLPAVAKAAEAYMTVKKVNAANTVTIDGYGSETIDGAANKALTTQWSSYTLYCDGTGWFIL